MPPELVAPMVAFLAHEDCPVTGEIYTAGGGRFARLFLASTEGYVHADGAPTIEDVADHWADDQRRDRLLRPRRPHGLVERFLHEAPAADETAMQPDLSWCAVLAHHATRTPDQAITVFEGETTTYGEMAERAAALAGGPRRARRRAAATSSALLSYNCPEMLETIFAANHLGAIAMPINWRLAAPEVRYILEHSGARALVCDDDARRRSPTRRPRASRPRSLRACVAPAAPDGWTPLADLRTRDAGRRRARRRADDVHRLMYTSGTTGRPEGRDAHPRQPGLEEPRPPRRVRLHQRRPRARLRAAVPRRRARPHDHLADRGGRAPSIIHRTFDAAAVVDELERSRVTTVWLAPAMVNAIMALPDVEQRDLSSVRVIINGGEKMPIPLIERIQRTFPSAWFADAYGLTETVSGDTFLDRDSIVTKLGSVGRPCLHLELDVWDDEGRSVAPGEQGEIVLRGPEGVQGLLARPRRHRARRSPAAGSTPATSACATRTATSSSSTASRT